MQDFSASPRVLASSYWRNRDLVKKLAIREVSIRYKGSFFGLFWSMLNPLLMLGVYTFVFGVVFKTKWNVGDDSGWNYASMLFLGLMPFNFFAECLIKSPTLILNNVNYVKKVVFPLDVLPMILLFTALFHFVVSFGIWLMFYSIFITIPSISFLLLPIVFLPIIFIALGASFFLASLGVYFRDINQIMGLVVSITMFLSPIFYPITSLPVFYQDALVFNPITLEIEFMRQLLVQGVFPGIEPFLNYLIVSIIICFAGFAWFQKTRAGFADVI